MGENQEPKSHIPIRLNILFFIVFIFFAAIILRLAYVQIVEGEQYQHDLEKYSTRKLPIPAPRGRIMDVNQNILVSNKPVFTVTYTSEQNMKLKSEDEEQLASNLASMLQTDEKIGTDKELVKKVTDLKTTIDVTFSPEQKNQLIQMITPKLQALPKHEELENMSDYDLIKTAHTLREPIRSPFDDADRDELQKKLPKTIPVDGKQVETANAYDRDLINHLMTTNTPYPIVMEDEARTSMQENLNLVLSKLPQVKDLPNLDATGILQLVSRFNLDISLPLTPEQRLKEWNRITILGRMRDSSMPKFIPRRIKENATEVEVARVNERLGELPGIDVIVEPVRQIKKDVDGKAFATHILGYINPIESYEVEELLSQGYSQTDRIGKEGLEKSYEKELRGNDGVMEVQVNQSSETVVKKETRRAEPGNDLILSLDWRFQSKVEEILKTRMEEMKRSSKSREVETASVVVMNPNTGEVLALANYPDYDLNLRYNRKEFNEKYEKEIMPAENNLATRGLYPPGSTVKPVSVMLGLQEKLITPQTTINDPGYFWFGNVKKRNWRSGGHGIVNVRRALGVSNNTYMYNIGWRLKEREQAAGNGYRESFNVIEFYNQQFGLGVKTGIDLPGEKSGLKPTADEMGRIADAMIGQYENFTPIQLAQYTSVIANGGYRIKPHLVKEIRKGSEDPLKPGEVLSIIKPTVLNKISIDPSYIKLVQEGMLQVTRGEGTARVSMAGLPYNVAAKTGTAQTGVGADNSLIVGYAPYEKPEMVFVVVVPKANHGSDYIARDILDAYHEMFSLFPNDQPATNSDTE
ncbi:penicillin-binding transpeptidase domain-containing protein [Brevibacillus daliensis]|uniref:penicillin-binding transpeptidase domain-containing protein n=1 Tax=Brevibacillus daliensis TaxID=2892995 RepID=UPI001E3E6CE0|nr:penicillin-binding transpeptidase domain-containing protein [Brevibacillus daliensis]